MKPKFTKGPWKLTGKTLRNSDNKIVNTSPVFRTQNHLIEVEANGKLIEESPKSYELIVKSYLIMQIQSNIDPVFAVTTDSLRASYRNYICDVLGKTDKEVQETIEEMAFKIKNHSLSFPEAINKLI
jgi:hypothetical protein